MDLKTIKKKIPETRVFGKLKRGEEERWIELAELVDIKYFIAYGDDGGDAFIVTMETEEEFNKKLPRFIMGERNCDFSTDIYLIVKNGAEYVPKIA